MIFFIFLFCFLNIKKYIFSLEDINLGNAPPKKSLDYISNGLILFCLKKTFFFVEFRQLVALKKMSAGFKRVGIINSYISYE